MQTFKQFLEAREVRDIPHNDIYQILRHIDDPIICVKFALYCAEDCFHLNNEQTREPAQIGIALVKKWLRDTESVTRNELRSTISTVYNAADAAAWATNNTANNTSAAWAAKAAANANTAAYNVAINNANAVAVAWAVENAAVAFAYASGHQYNTPEWDQIRDQKLQEYINKLKGMTTTRTGYTKHSEMLKGYDNTEEAIRLALDELEDLGEIGKEHFVYQDNDGQWVFDLGHDNILRAASKEALARLIHNDRYYLNALLRLYNANV